jgi:hypothetical protein
MLMESHSNDILKHFNPNFIVTICLLLINQLIPCSEAIMFAPIFHQDSASHTTLIGAEYRAMSRLRPF